MTNPRDALLTYIKSLIDKHSVVRLPSQRALAKQWGMSDTTVKSVLRPFIRDGLIVAIPGKGSFAGPISDPRSTPNIPADAVDTLVTAIKSRIQRGELASGQPLPQVKFIKFQYGVAQNTVSKAYQTLERDGYAHRIGRKYWVGRFSRTPRPERVTIIISPDGSIFHQGHLAPAWRAMERELAINNTRCRSILESEFSRLAPSVSNVLSIAVANVTIDNAQRIISQVDRYERLVNRPRNALLLVGSDILDRIKIPKHANYLCPGTFAKDVARKVASYIIDNRFDAVALFCRGGRNEDMRRTIRILKEILHVNRQAVVRIHLTLPQECSSIRDVLALDTSFAEHGFEYIRNLLDRYFPFSLEDFEGLCTVAEQQSPDFTKFAGIPFWVFADDQTALEAIEWCRLSRKKIPHEISLLGSENSPESYHKGLSTCALDFQTIGYLMAHALLGDMQLTRTTRGYMYTPVHLIHRATTP